MAWKALAQAVGGRWIARAEKDQSFAELFAIGSIDELLKPTGAGKGGSAVVLSAFGEAFTDITKPAANQIVDLGKLGG